MTQTHDTVRKDSELGPIPQEWDVYTMDDLVDINKKTLGKDFSFKTIRYYDTGSVTEGVFSEPEKFDIGEAPSRAKRLAELGDIVISTVRPIQKHYGFIQENLENDIYSTGFAIVSPRKSKVDGGFLYRFLTQGGITSKLQQLAEHNTSTYPSFRPEDIKDLEIPLPPIHEQQVIASVLGSLDDKIELLREQNRILEKIGQTIFNSRFIDFDFPGSKGFMAESELGMVPKGWRVGKLGEIADITSGKRPNNKSDKLEGEFQIPILGAGGVMGYTTDILLDKHLIIMGRVGTHGQISRVNYPCRPSDNTLITQSKYFEYVYQTICGIDFTSLNKGAVQPLITQTDIKNYPVIIPSDEILNEFENTNGELFEKVYINNLEIDNLIKTRDSLLPRLMSGKVRVF